MSQEIYKKLMQNRDVVEEINRHLWIESEKAGYDIGFEKASEDWLKSFSKAWMDYHMPERKSISFSASLKRNSSQKASIKNSSSKVKTE